MRAVLGSQRLGAVLKTAGGRKFHLPVQGPEDRTFLAKLTGKLKALLRGHAGGGIEQFGDKQLRLWKDALDEAVAEGDDEESAPEPEPEPKSKPRRLTRPASLPHRTIETRRRSPTMWPRLAHRVERRA